MLPKTTVYKIAFIIVAFFLSLVLKNSTQVFIWMGIFLPTIIHVFMFTALFIIYGALKGRSKSAVLSLVVLVLCAASFFVVQTDFSLFKITPYITDSMIKSGFASLNSQLIQTFGLGAGDGQSVFATINGISIMRFIAFGYTYHYLNWFSKTSIIKWHEVKTAWLVAAIAIWIGAVAIYIYDYSTGIKVLFLLSMLHVFLEFPLNFKTIQAIGTESLSLAGMGATNSKPVVSNTKKKRSKSKR